MSRLFISDVLASPADFLCCISALDDPYLKVRIKIGVIINFRGSCSITRGGTQVCSNERKNCFSGIRFVFRDLLFDALKFSTRYLIVYSK